MSGQSTEHLCMKAAVLCELCASVRQNHTYQLCKNTGVAIICWSLFTIALEFNY